MLSRRTNAWDGLGHEWAQRGSPEIAGLLASVSARRGRVSIVVADRNSGSLEREQNAEKLRNRAV